MAKPSEFLNIKLPPSPQTASSSAVSTPDAEMLTPDAENVDDNSDSGSAPIEMLSEFLSAVMSRDYEAALNYCKTILLYEPGNKIVQEFYPLIQEKILQANVLPQKEEMDSDENTGGEEDDNSSFSSKSASSNEFTSGGSDFDNEDENGNSTSDDNSSTSGGGWKTALNTDSDSTEKDNEPDSNSNTESPTLHIDACANHLHSLSL